MTPSASRVNPAATSPSPIRSPTNGRSFPAAVSAVSSSWHLPSSPGVLLAVQPPVQADDRIVLDQHVVQRRRRDLAAREADHQDASLERDALGRLGVGRAAHRVVDDIHAAALRGGLHRGDDVLRQPVDHQVGAEVTRHRRLGRTADHRDDPRARGLAELHRGAADTARRGVHQQRLARAQVRPTVQREPAGVVGDQEAARGGVVQRLRRREGEARVQHGELGESAVRQYRHADHPLPHRETVGPRARADHLAAQLDPGGERQRRFVLVDPAAHQHVREVRRRGPDSDQQLPRAGCRDGYLGELEHLVWFTDAGDLPGLHLATAPEPDAQRYALLGDGPRGVRDLRADAGRQRGRRRRVADSGGGQYGVGRLAVQALQVAQRVRGTGRREQPGKFLGVERRARVPQGPGGRGRTRRTPATRGQRPADHRGPQLLVLRRFVLARHRAQRLFDRHPGDHRPSVAQHRRQDRVRQVNQVKALGARTWLGAQAYRSWLRRLTGHGFTSCRRSARATRAWQMFPSVIDDLHPGYASAFPGHVRSHLSSRAERRMATTVRIRTVDWGERNGRLRPFPSRLRPLTSAARITVLERAVRYAQPAALGKRCAWETGYSD